MSAPSYHCSHVSGDSGSAVLPDEPHPFPASHLQQQDPHHGWLVTPGRCFDLFVFHGAVSSKTPSSVDCLCYPIWHLLFSSFLHQYLFPPSPSCLLQAWVYQENLFLPLTCHSSVILFFLHLSGQMHFWKCESLYLTPSPPNLQTLSLWTNPSCPITPVSNRPWRGSPEATSLAEGNQPRRLAAESDASL